MVNYLLQRLLGAISVLFGVSVVAFGLYALTPGALYSPPREAIDARRAELHLNDPMPVQYLNWIAGELHGDFGRAFRSYTPVTELYLSRIGATALLACVATLLSLIIALPLGVLAAYQRGRMADRVAQIVVALGGSMPGFWIGLLLILVFAVELHWLAALGSPKPQRLWL